MHALLIPGVGAKEDYLFGIYFPDNGLGHALAALYEEFAFLYTQFV